MDIRYKVGDIVQWSDARLNAVRLAPVRVTRVSKVGKRQRLEVITPTGKYFAWGAEVMGIAGQSYDVRLEPTPLVSGARHTMSPAAWEDSPDEPDES